MDFAFLIHSRDYKDVEKKFKIAKFLPRKLIEYWCLHWPPVLVSRVTGLEDKEGKECKGYIIGIPMTAKQMMENRELAQQRVVQAINKAEKLGVKIVGLGALTSSVTGGGELIKEKVKISLTNGNAFTVSVAYDHVSHIIYKNTEIKNISVVGATGSIGQAITKLLIKNFPNKNYYLFARTEENLNNLLAELRNTAEKVNIKGFLNNISPLAETDLIVVATSSPDVLIHSGNLKQNAIIYDMTQPQNIDKKTLQDRVDLTIYDGGLVFAPGLKSKLPFGLPKKIIFACLGETILLSLADYQKHFSLGKVKLDQISEITKIANVYKFKPIEIIK